ncbi:MAG: hypothetical protein JEZ06_14400 [Anaerolineaceae bacterium]|nr:hypothetical protein [Anaerolineaceae bacterium]
MPVVFRWIILFLIVALILGCSSGNFLAGEENSQGDENLGIEEPVSEIGDTKTPTQAPIKNADDNPLQESDSDEISPDEGGLSLSCPSETFSGKLELNHTFNWSANRDTETFFVEGQTLENAWCLINLIGEKVETEECLVSYTNKGAIQTDAGACTITGEGMASIEISGSCKDGKISLEISEFPDGELGNLMECPGNVTQPYPGMYPPSLSTIEFFIAVEGYTATEFVEVDATRQFSYNKNWNLIFPDTYFLED